MKQTIIKHTIWLLITLFLFQACTGSSEEENSTTTQALKETTNFNPSTKTITIYVPDYQKTGYALKGVYGESFESDFLDSLVEFTGLPTLENYTQEDFRNLLTTVQYYGEEAPFYYTFLDTTDINRVTTSYGGGIPRYAIIVAKFANYLLEETGAEKINFISQGMGSLVTRWLIENNTEQLASQTKIEKWMSMDGLIRGNYLLSRSTQLQDFFETSVDTQQMQYSWIEENLTPTAERMSSPYYKNILVGQISSTQSDGAEVGLASFLSLEGQFQANNGYQLLKDTYFETIDYAIQVPSQTYLYNDYANLTENDALYVTLNNFLEAKKRVRITLVEATVNDIHETLSLENPSSEIVFSNQIFSPYAQTQWELEDQAIAEQRYESGMLTLYDYQSNGESKTVNQILFDDFVSSVETNLTLQIEGYELDKDSNYKLTEEGISSKESLGSINQTIELIHGKTYNILTNDWSASLKVEVVEM